MAEKKKNTFSLGTLLFTYTFSLSLSHTLSKQMQAHSFTNIKTLINKLQFKTNNLKFFYGLGIVLTSFNFYLEVTEYSARTSTKQMFYKFFFF